MVSPASLQCDRFSAGEEAEVAVLPPRAETRSHDVTLPPFVSATGSREEPLLP